MEEKFGKHFWNKRRVLLLDPKNQESKGMQVAALRLFQIQVSGRKRGKTHAEE